MISSWREKSYRLNRKKWKVVQKKREAKEEKNEQIRCDAEMEANKVEADIRK